MKLRIMLLVGALAASVFPYTSLHAMNYEEERVIKIAKLAPLFTGAWQKTLPNNQTMELVLWQVDPDDFYQQYNGSEEHKGYLKQTITKHKKNHRALYAGYVQIKGQPCKKYIKGVVSGYSFATQDNPNGDRGLILTMLAMQDASVPYQKCDALIPRLAFLAKPPYTVNIMISGSDELIPLNRVSATGGLLAKAKNGRPFIGNNANSNYYFYMSRSVPTTSELEVIADKTKTLPEVTTALAGYHKHLKQVAKPSVPAKTYTMASAKKAKIENCSTCLPVDNSPVIDPYSHMRLEKTLWRGSLFWYWDDPELSFSVKPHQAILNPTRLTKQRNQLKYTVKFKNNDNSKICVGNLTEIGRSMNGHIIHFNADKPMETCSPKVTHGYFFPYSQKTFNLSLYDKDKLVANSPLSPIYYKVDLNIDPKTRKAVKALFNKFEKRVAVARRTYDTKHSQAKRESLAKKYSPEGIKFCKEEADKRIIQCRVLRDHSCGMNDPYCTNTVLCKGGIGDYGACPTTLLYEKHTETTYACDPESGHYNLSYKRLLNKICLK